MWLMVGCYFGLGELEEWSGWEIKFGAKEPKCPLSWEKGYPEAKYRVMNSESWDEWVKSEWGFDSFLAGSSFGIWSWILPARMVLAGGEVGVVKRQGPTLLFGLGGWVSRGGGWAGYEGEETVESPDY